jgi:inorganic pyrophosphatase
MEYNNEFWEAIDKLLAESELVIDRPKGAAHPRYPSFIYPIDYGYLKGTTSPDGGGIDVWRGSCYKKGIDKSQMADAIICTVDLMKRDSEIKILLGCTEEEKELIYKLQTQSEFMKGILIRR